jgi:hypothetical protein
MKEFSQYTSVEDVVRDLIAERVFSRNKRVREMFPSVVAKPPRKNHLGPVSANRIDLLKTLIVEAVKDKPFLTTLSRTKLNRIVRGDNHPQEFKIAIEQLIAERKITEEKMWTKKVGRPYVH